MSYRPDPGVLHVNAFTIPWKIYVNKHNQKPTDMFHKQDVTVYLTYIKILKDLNILNFRLHFPEAMFKVLKQSTNLKFKIYKLPWKHICN